MSDESTTIKIKNARIHNLKNLSVDIPKNKLVAITGVSGSGKSSLAFDTIFAEGQRRYIESLSPYARQFLDEMKKPDVEEITGLSPAIAIDQKAMSANPRSTVATLTEIYDYLRVLFARIGTPYCIKCSKPIEKLSTDEMVDVIKEKFKEKKAKKMMILSPVVMGRKGEYYQLLYDYLNKGFDRARIDKEFYSLHEKIELTRYQNHTIEIVIDELDLKDETRLVEAVERALELSEGLVTVLYYDKPKELENDKIKEELLLSSSRTCPECGFSFPEIEPRLFSFNSPYGACPHCDGLGTIHKWTDKICPKCDGKRLKKEALAVKLSDKNIDQITSMSIKKTYDFFQNLSNNLNNSKFEIAFNLLEEITSRLKFLKKVGLDYLTLDRRAGTLAGGEAQRIRLASQLGSKLSGALYILDEPTIGLHARDTNRLMNTLKGIRDLGNTVIIVEHDPKVIKQSDYLIELGPGPGEMGGKVVTKGKVDELLKTENVDKEKEKNKRKEKSNKGDNKSENSLTLKYLNKEKKISKRQYRGKVNKKLSLKGVNLHNLKDINIDIPLNKLISLTGVSGSGKSSLFEVIGNNLPKLLKDKGKGDLNNPDQLDNLKKVKGIKHVNDLVKIDQKPIGRSSRSNPATYSNAFTPIRELFAQVQASRERGFSKSRFSFNVDPGRCEACSGAGYKEVEMHFLPSVEVECEICKGKRFNKETLEVKYEGKNIAQVLDMTIDEAYNFFKDIPKISDKLLLLKEVGLGYLKMGQSATTLSGGEAQRLKLARELTKRSRGTLYLLDEPTVGLHWWDLEMLLEVLQKLVDKGNTVMVIEHNLDMIKSADWIIDLGKEGGEKGGNIIIEGPVKEAAKYEEESYTAKFLKEKLNEEKT